MSLRIIIIKVSLKKKSNIIIRSLCPIYPIENSMNIEHWEEFILEDNPKIVILPSIIAEFANVILY